MNVVVVCAWIVQAKCQDRHPGLFLSGLSKATFVLYSPWLTHTALQFCEHGGGFDVYFLSYTALPLGSQLQFLSHKNPPHPRQQGFLPCIWWKCFTGFVCFCLNKTCYDLFDQRQLWNKINMYTPWAKLPMNHFTTLLTHFNHFLHSQMHRDRISAVNM